MSRLPILLRKPPSRPTNPRTYPKSAQQNESGDQVRRLIAHNAKCDVSLRPQFHEHDGPHVQAGQRGRPWCPRLPRLRAKRTSVRAALETRGKMGCQGLPTTRKEPPVWQLLISQVHIRQRGCIWRVRSARLRPRRRSRRQSALGATEQTRAWRAARCSRSGGCFRGS